jgi:hypothetical protein
MLKTSLLSLAAAGFLFAGAASVPTTSAEAGYSVHVGYGGHGYGHRKHYRKHYRKRHHYDHCRWIDKRVKVRFYDDYYGHYDYKYVTKRVRVCDY